MMWTHRQGLSTRGVQNLIFSTPTPLLRFKNWFLLLFKFWQKSREVLTDINFSKTLWLKIILAPAPATVSIKNIHFRSCLKILSPAGVYSGSCTPLLGLIYLSRYLDYIFFISITFISIPSLIFGEKLSLC